MAQIDLNTIKQLEKERNLVHEKVVTTYTVFGDDRKKYVQIDTYGKSDRALPEKISQSIQFDRETARFLVKLFMKEYGFSIDVSE
jgi:transposase-like protein